MARVLSVELERVMVGSVSSRELESLAGFSFNIERGETVLLRGPTGCGKSVLLEVLSGVWAAGSALSDVEPHGDITFRWNGDEPVLLTPDVVNSYLQSVAIVSQEVSYSMVGDTVIEELVYPLELLGLSTKEIDRRIDIVVALLDIGELLNTNISELSAGWKQYISAAAALARLPQLLLMDEPFACLDDMRRNKLTSAIQQLISEGEIGGAVIATHDEELRKKISESREVRIPHADETLDALQTCETLDQLQNCEPRREPVDRAVTIDQAAYGYKRSSPKVQYESLRLEEGRLYTLAGPNGSGKTTTLRGICGLLPVSKQRLCVRGILVDSPSDLLPRRFGITLQEALYHVAEMTVDAEISLQARKTGKEEMWVASCKRVLAAARVESSSNVYHLSVGQRKLLYILLSLAAEELVLLDEPLWALDHGLVELLHGLLRRKLAKGSTILVATHHPERFGQHGPIKYRISNGGLRADG